MNIGEKFHRWTIVGPVEKQGPYRYVPCECECGIRKNVYCNSLTDGRSKSCGCYGREQTRSRVSTNITHGHTRRSGSNKINPTYQSWRGISQRCRPDVPKNKYYGVRGITVCERWASYENFLADMGERPSPKHTLDRINVNGNYEPENCRWATRWVQDNNKRNSDWLEIDGQVKTVTEWVKISGVGYTTVRQRLDKGWDGKEAVFSPPIPRERRRKSKSPAKASNGQAT